MSGIFVQILMTRFFDLVTGNNLKGWFQQDNLLRWQVVQATRRTPESRPGRKPRIAGEQRVKNMQRREIHCTIIARDVLLYVDLVMYMSISEVLVKTCWSNAKFLPIFCLPKIGSKQNWL